MAFFHLYCHNVCDMLYGSNLDCFTLLPLYDPIPKRKTYKSSSIPHTIHTKVNHQKSISIPKNTSFKVVYSNVSVYAHPFFCFVTNVNHHIVYVVFLLVQLYHLRNHVEHIPLDWQNVAGILLCFVPHPMVSFSMRERRGG